MSSFKKLSIFVRKACQDDEVDVEKLWRDGILVDERSHFFPILLKQPTVFFLYVGLCIIFLLLRQYMLCVLSPIVIWLWVYYQLTAQTRNYVNTQISDRSIYGDELFVAEHIVTKKIVGIIAYTMVSSLGNREFKKSACMIKSLR